MQVGVRPQSGDLLLITMKFDLQIMYKLCSLLSTWDSTYHMEEFLVRTHNTVVIGNLNSKHLHSIQFLMQMLLTHTINPSNSTTAPDQTLT